MIVYVATKNKRKIALARELIGKFLDDDMEVAGCSVESGVPDNPWDRETYQGARNRAKNALKQNSSADIGLGIETGLTERYGQLYEETWCCVADRKGQEFWGYASGNVIADNIERRVIENKETGAKTLEIFNPESNSWLVYSGNPNIRESCLANAISQALLQYKFLRFSSGSKLADKSLY